MQPSKRASKTPKEPIQGAMSGFSHTCPGVNSGRCNKAHASHDSKANRPCWSLHPTHRRHKSNPQRLRSGAHDFLALAAACPLPRLIWSGYEI